MRIFLTIILGYFILPLNAQYFEGNIRYEYSFINEKGVDITDSLGSVLGTYQDYYVNESNYKSFMDGPISFQLYKSESNTYYMKYSDGRAYKLDAAKKFFSVGIGRIGYRYHGSFNGSINSLYKGFNNFKYGNSRLLIRNPQTEVPMDPIGKPGLGVFIRIWDSTPE